MKQFTTILILFFMYGHFYSQTWQTVRLNTSAGLNIFPPYKGFKINPYTNDLWFLNTSRVSCLEADGSVHFLDLSEYPSGCNPDITFTPSNPYFRNTFSGLYRVNADYSKVLVYSGNDLGNVYSNGDTVYMDLHSSSNGYLTYTANGIFTVPIDFSRIEAKGTIKYPAYTIDGNFMKYTGSGFGGFQTYNAIDDEYLCGLFHDAKFSRLTDTFYVSCTQGITKAINYDFNDSIVPSNTINMPSANVIEFEFDDQDRLWAVFGDANDVPFAFARLDGNEWTNRYDVSNCPINFAEYKGLEIDTLGNLWISERFYLHTLLTPNSPVWLGTQELSLETLEAYPNPAEDQVTIKLPNAGGRLQVATLSGVVLLEESNLTEKEVSLDISSWTKGCYVATWTDDDRKQQVLIVK